MNAENVQNTCVIFELINGDRFKPTQAPGLTAVQPSFAHAQQAIALYAEEQARLIRNASEERHFIILEGYKVRVVVK